MTDRFGRKKLFMLTLGIYIVATVATAFSFAPWYFFLARFVTGSGIGGEYAAINSAIDELIPARVRGRVDLVINGTYWLGSAAGAALSIVLLNTALFPADIGWRCAFGIGAVLGLTIMLVRRHVPASPRWLFIHGREAEAERIVDSIEHDVAAGTGEPLAPVDDAITVRQRRTIGFRTIARTAIKVYPKRTILGLALFVGQAFLYNGVTFDLGTTSVALPAGVLAAEVRTIAETLQRRGPLDRGALADAVGARRWGPGRFATALRTAVIQGRATRTTRRTYGPATDGRSDAK